MFSGKAPFFTFIKKTRGKDLKGKNVLRNSKNFLKFKKNILNTSHKFLGYTCYIKQLFSVNPKKPSYALIENKMGSRSLVPAAHNLSYFSKIKIMNNFYFSTKFLTLGNYICLKFLKVNSICFNIITLSGIQLNYALAAGTFFKIFYFSYCKRWVICSIPSGKKIRINKNFFCILGRNSNIYHNKEILGSASNFLNFGHRPTVRGVAMNPVDHPHGGRTKTSKPEVSPWGWVTKHKH